MFVILVQCNIDFTQLFQSDGHLQSLPSLFELPKYSKNNLFNIK